MQTKGNKAAFAKLREYEKRSESFRPGDGRGGDSASQWSGVTFQLADTRLTCDIERIIEILPCAEATPVPGAKPWILGLANVRGALLTVIDLGWFLTGAATEITARSRLLSTNLQKAPIGLLIDEVFGQRHFTDGDSKAVELAQEEPLRDYVSHEFSSGTETWRALNLDQLFSTGEFLNGAAE